MTPAYFVNTETTTFQPGQIIVVSGPDNGAIIDMLFDARDALITAGKGCLDPLDTRMTTIYPDGLVIAGPSPTTSQFATHTYVSLFENISITMVGGANNGLTRNVLEYDRASNVMTLDAPLLSPPAVGDGFSLNVGSHRAPERAFKYEYYSVTYRASGPLPKVILVSNRFDREDPNQNIANKNVDIDVVMDLLNIKNVANVHDSFRLSDGRYREIFGYISKLYYFDTRNDDITFIKNQIPERP